MHDARVSGNSTLYSQEEVKHCFLSGKKVIAQEEVPLVVREDPPHPLLPWVMKPYIDNGHLSHDQRSFSYHLSTARVVVEDAYVCLKGWW